MKALMSGGLTQTTSYTAKKRCRVFRRPDADKFRYLALTFAKADRAKRQTIVQLLRQSWYAPSVSMAIRHSKLQRYRADIWSTR